MLVFLRVYLFVNKLFHAWMSDCDLIISSFSLNYQKLKKKKNVRTKDHMDFNLHFTGSIPNKNVG